MVSSVVLFYSGEGVDHRGRSLDAILDFTDGELETVHDFVQWLFPIETPSPVNRLAPTVSRDTQIAFRTNVLLRKNLCRACSRMLRFYGLTCQGEAMASVRVLRDRDFLAKSATWMVPGNHNHRRLTRILKSLRLLGLEACSRSLFLYLEELATHDPSSILQVTLDYWRDSQETPTDS